MSEKRLGETFTIEGTRTDSVDTIAVEQMFTVADLRIDSSGELYCGPFPIAHALAAGMITREELQKFQRVDAAPQPSRLRVLCGLDEDPEHARLRAKYKF
jgi:hypothetical protein